MRTHTLSLCIYPPTVCLSMCLCVYLYIYIYIYIYIRSSARMHITHTHFPLYIYAYLSLSIYVPNPGPSATTNATSHLSVPPSSHPLPSSPPLAPCPHRRSRSAGRRGTTPRRTTPLISRYIQPLALSALLCSIIGNRPQYPQYSRQSTTPPCAPYPPSQSLAALLAYIIMAGTCTVMDFVLPR